MKKRIVATAVVLLALVGAALWWPMLRVVERSRVIAAPQAAVHVLLADLSLWNGWAPVELRDPASSHVDGDTWRYKTLDGEEKGIRRVSAGPNLLRYEMVHASRASFEVALEPASGGGTKVTWRHTVRLDGPAKLALLWRSPEEVMAPYIEKSLDGLSAAATAPRE